MRATEQAGRDTVTKVSTALSKEGPLGQAYLASGHEVAMRLWDEAPGESVEAAHSRDYETVGYVLEGRAELNIDGEVVLLEPGDSWVVPRGAQHFYRILEGFKAVEATTPPARDGRDRQLEG